MTTHHLAVGQDHSEIAFVADQGGASGPADKWSGNTESMRVERVRCCGVDELVNEFGFPEPDIVKFDLETAERFALLNGDRVFSNKRPRLIVEIHLAEGNGVAEALIAFKERYGYTCHLIWQDMKVIHDISVLEELIRKEHWNQEVLALPNEYA